MIIVWNDGFDYYRKAPITRDLKINSSLQSEYDKFVDHIIMYARGTGDHHQAGRPESRGIGNERHVQTIQYPQEKQQ